MSAIHIAMNTFIEHSIHAGTSVRWLHLIAINQSFTDILKRVPDEFYDWVKTTVATFTAQYEAIETECKAAFQVRSSRKETALYFQTQQYPAVLFQMLDGHDYSATIWKMLRPAYERPFKKAADG
ncbi:MAG: hypothetical protein EOO39_22215 [Cytophagaceae bacterium]|nr:MAG: hypothetical protein EOO39_22215 [Cytophagaceae bacterium]